MEITNLGIFVLKFWKVYVNFRFSCSNASCFLLLFHEKLKQKLIKNFFFFSDKMSQIWNLTEFCYFAVLWFSSSEEQKICGAEKIIYIPKCVPAWGLAVTPYYSAENQPATSVEDIVVKMLIMSHDSNGAKISLI